MKVSRNETIRIRKNLLREMDDYLRSNVNESTVEYIQFAVGLEDGWDENILTEYAEDDELRLDCVKAFKSCYECEGIIKQRNLLDFFVQFYLLT